MRRFFKKCTSILLALIAAVLSVPASVFADGVKNINSIDDLNIGDAVLDSHAGEIQNSSLEYNFREAVYLKSDDIVGEGLYAWYPRVKRLAEDRYILFFQNGRWGPDIYYCISSDGKNWDEPKYIFKSHDTCLGRYIRGYATLDAILLQNGDLLVGACFQATAKDGGAKPSRFLMTEKGLVTRVSKDLGETWSEPEIIYHGRSWEPYFLQLPSGEVQMYFTHSAPKDALYTTQMGSTPSSGVAMMSSIDNGDNWTPLPLTYPYVAKRIVQQPNFVHNGIQLMTDQMCVAVLLNNGKTIAMVTESGTGKDEDLAISLIRSHDYFARELAVDEYGPEDRTDNFAYGLSPYIVQFPSGEVAISYFASRKTKLILANETATELYMDSVVNPFQQLTTGMWSSMFIDDSHTMIAASGDVIVETGVKTNLRSKGVGVSRLELNHRIDAKTMTPTLDGISTDWQYNTDALFVGSESQAQTALRVAHDGDNLYILMERLDCDLSVSGDTLDVSVTKKDGKGYYKFSVGVNGLISSSVMGAPDADLSAVECVTAVYGTADDPSDEDEGYIAELKIPKSVFGDTDEYKVMLRLSNYDAATRYSDPDTFDGTAQFDPETWPAVRLVSEKAEAPAESGNGESNVTEDPLGELPSVTPAEPVQSNTGKIVIIGAEAAIILAAAVAMAVCKKKK